MAAWDTSFTSDTRRADPAVSASTIAFNPSSRTNVAALAKRHGVAVNRLDRLKRGTLWRHELMLDAQKVFANDVKTGVRHQVVHVGNASGQRVFDGDHGERCVALRSRRRTRPRKSGRARPRGPEKFPYTPNESKPRAPLGMRYLLPEGGRIYFLVSS